MKNILNNKFVVIAIITAILIVTLSSGVFAVSYDYNNTTYEVPSFSSKLIDGGAYCLIYGLSKDGNGNPLSRFYLFVSDRTDEPCFGYNDDNVFTYRYSKCYYCNFTYREGWSSLTTNISGYPSNLTDLTNVDIIETDSIVYKTNYVAGSVTTFTDEVVFPLAPQMPAITKTLVEQTTQTQIAEQLKTMIAGFLKYLIALVISVIAFWKGWKFLSQQFKKA